MQTTLEKLRKHEADPRYGSYLREQHFWLTVLVAMLLHAGGFGIYQLLPKEIVEQIPVRVLNIKIGRTQTVGPDVADSSSASAPPAAAAPVSKKEIPKPAKPVKKPAPSLRKPVPKAAVIPAKAQAPEPEVVEKEAPKMLDQTLQDKAFESKFANTETTPGAKRYVREGAVTATGEEEITKPGATGDGSGSTIGNSFAKSAEIESRYTQTLSLWLNRFKVYPKEAREKRIGGTVMLRIRIDRQGTILRYFLERSSGQPIIDQAISTMVNAANPVPAVPPYYPDSRPYLEFLVPVHFKSNTN